MFNVQCHVRAIGQSTDNFKIYRPTILSIHINRCMYIVCPCRSFKFITHPRKWEPALNVVSDLLVFGGCVRCTARSMDPLLTDIKLESVTVHANALLAQRTDNFTRKLHF